MWACEMKRKSWAIARCGHRPISNDNLRDGKMTQVSWPPIDKPSTGYPSMVKPLAFFEVGSGESWIGSEPMLLLPAILD